VADPTKVQSAAGTSALASTSATFSAATAGNLLVLATGADDYRTGSPSGWTQIAAEQQTFHGLNFWYKFAAGGETSVTYVIGSAARSVWAMAEFDNVASFGSGQGTFVQASAASQATPTHTPSAGRKLILAVVGFSTSSASPAMSGYAWASITLTSAQISLGPASNPQEYIGIGWTVADYTGSNTVASTASIAGIQPGQARTAIIGSFAVAGAAAAYPFELLTPTPRYYRR
jgi:hypothetical protein